ncbi:unnamed protein product [Owenia fusiformis]|uniref:Spindle and kinetochore-associated protein 3 n=1 Tax=Owenia fusiformis TaxID=6347 RepID=A0A8J1TBA0_OWEFU|nr:unnamed protein product [Owenia fusiformis]
MMARPPGDSIDSLSFFAKLRRVAKSIDQTHDDLQKELSRPLGDKTNISDSSSADFELLRIDNEISSIKKEAQGLYMSTRKNTFSGFLKNCQALLDNRSSQLSHIEGELKKYGFTPKISTEQPVASESTESTKTFSHEAKENLPGYHPTTTEASTPPPKENPGRVMAPRTPKLEDFGVSAGTLMAVSRLNNPGKAGEFKVPQLNNHQLPGSTTIPTPFQNTGLYVTPGIGDVFSNVSMTPNDRGYNPNIDSPASGPATPAMCLGTEQRNALDTPEPPIFETPGARQIQRTVAEKPFEIRKVVKCEYNIGDEESPIPPVLSTPGLKQISKGHPVSAAPQQQNIQSSTNQWDSPVPPLLQTPGIKQIKKSSNPNIDDLPRGPTMGLSMDDDMPQTPELTITHEGISKWANQVQPTTIPQPPCFQTGNPQMVAGFHMGLTQESDDLQPPILESTRPDRLDELPQAPDLLSQKLQLGDDEDDMPEPPQFTGTYNFYPTTVEQAPVFKSPDRVEVKEKRMLYLDEGEYLTLNDYLQSMLSLDVINSAIDGINALFDKKIRDGMAETVTQTEVRELLNLGPFTKSLLLLLMKLHRLKSTSKTANEAHFTRL